METPKQKAIREAYGEHWDTVNEHVDEQGYLHHPKGGEVTFDPFIGFMDEHINEDAYRPKSLSGIETNNGWITISSESDLPIEVDVFCHVANLKDNKHRVHNSPVKRATIKKWFKEGKVTHYKPIEKPNPPIY